MFLWVECNIRISTNFRQNHLFLAGGKTTVFQNDRFDNPERRCSHTADFRPAWSRSMHNKDATRPPPAESPAKQTSRKDKVKGGKNTPTPSLSQKGLQVCYCLWGVPSRPSPGSYPGPVQVPSRVRGGPVQIRLVLCFTVFRTHPGPEVGAIPARPGPILLPSVPYRIGPGRAETDFLATSDLGKN